MMDRCLGVEIVFHIGRDEGKVEIYRDTICESAEWFSITTWYFVMAGWADLGCIGGK